MKSAAAVLHRTDTLPFQRMKDETLVVDPKTREVHLLNETASRVWELLEKGMTQGQLVTTLAAEYEVDEPTLAKQIAAFVADLETKKLLKEPAAAAG